MAHLIDYVKYFFMSMVPIIELRGALPLAIAAEGLNPVIAYFFCNSIKTFSRKYPNNSNPIYNKFYIGKSEKNV